MTNSPILYADDIYTPDKRDLLFSRRLARVHGMKKRKMTFEEKLKRLFPANDQLKNQCTANVVSKDVKFLTGENLSVSRLWEAQNRKTNCRESLKAAKDLGFIDKFFVVPVDAEIWHEILTEYNIGILCHIPRKKGAWKEARETGFLDLRDNPDEEGIGHRTLLFHSDYSRGIVYGINSHGDEWGFCNNGVFFLSFYDLPKLLPNWQFIAIKK